MNFISSQNAFICSKCRTCMIIDIPKCTEKKQDCPEPKTLKKIPNKNQLSQITALNSMSFHQSFLKRTVSRVHSDSNIVFQHSVESNTLHQSLHLPTQSLDLNGQNIYPSLLEKQVVSVIIKILEYASEKSQIDYPLCLECTERLNNSLEKELMILEEQEKTYASHLSHLESEDELNEEQLTRQLEDLSREEELLRKELDQYKLEEEKLHHENMFIEEEQKQLLELEARYWEEYNDFEMRKEAYQEERFALEQQISLLKNELYELESTNIYNEVFHIWFEGHFGTINNFRLGKLQSQPVEWNEINAAWGYAAFLLDTIAKRIGFKFQNNKILPMGSFTKIQIGTLGVYELYGGQGGLWWASRFDKSMIAFLDCMKQLGDKATNEDPAFQYPYEIDGCKIGNLSIKCQSGDENWTRALKYVLTNLKWLITWVAKKT